MANEFKPVKFGCGRYFQAPGCIEVLPQEIKMAHGTKALIVGGKNGLQAAGAKIEQLLKDAGIDYYIYTMMVTFKLDFGKLFKIALIFAIAKLPLNVLITAILALIIATLIYSLSLTGIIAGVIIPVIFFSLCGFIIIFSTYPTIDKIMVQKVNKRVLNTRG